MIEQLIDKRYSQQLLRAKKNNYPLPEKQSYKFAFEKSFNEGFQCRYCNRLMKIKDENPFGLVASVDHLIPLCDGGGNNLLNIAICCLDCNLMKGSMSEITFKEFINKLGIDFYKKVLFESSKSRYAGYLRAISIKIPETRGLFDFA